MRYLLFGLILTLCVFPVFCKDSPFPTVPEIKSGNNIKIKAVANESFENEVSRFPTVIISPDGGGYQAAVKFSTFHDVIVQYTLEPDGLPSTTSSWSTAQMEHMRVFGNLTRGKRYVIRVIATYNHYKNRPDTYYYFKPLIICPPQDLTDRSNMSIFISNAYEQQESDFNDRSMKSVDLTDPATRKKMRMMGIDRHKDQRRAKIWEYAATGSKESLNESEDFAKLAQKIGGDKIKGIKEKLASVVGSNGTNMNVMGVNTVTPKPVPGSTSADGPNMAVFAMSKLRKAMLDKNNDGIPDILLNRIIRFPENMVEGPGAYVDRDPEFIFNKLKNGNYADFDDFLKKSCSRRYEITRTYIIPGDPPTYFTITVEEYYPLKIAVDYDNVPGAAVNKRYIPLWRYLWGEMYLTNLQDEVQNGPLIPYNDTADATAGTLVDDYQIVTVNKVEPMPYPE